MYSRGETVAELAITAPAFVEMAHRIVWCTVATTDAAGRPRTRVLHPIWKWNGTDLMGWIATAPNSLKRRHLDAVPVVSLTYWDPSHDTCSAECTTEWELDDDAKRRGWDRFVNAAAPVGYDPRLIPGWTAPDAESFGILRLMPHRLRVMPGTLMMAGQGELLTWNE